MWKKIVERFGLLPHPEGGFYRECYRSEQPVVVGERSFSASTAIYFLLRSGAPSHFHRIASDEIWHFYMGDSLIIHELNQNGFYLCHKVGSGLERGEEFLQMIPAGSWFAAETMGAYSFVGCTVAPGFEFQDFELASQKDLIRAFPDQEALIQRLTLE